MATTSDYSSNNIQLGNQEKSADDENELFFTFGSENKQTNYGIVVPERTKNLKDWNDTSTRVIGKASGIVLSMALCFGVSNTKSIHNIGTASLVPKIPAIEAKKEKAVLAITRKASTLKNAAPKAVFAKLENKNIESSAKTESVKKIESVSSSAMVETINGFVPFKDLTSSAFKKASAKAHKKGNKLLLKFGAKWCLPCRIMEETVFDTPEVQSIISEEYETLYIDIDSFDGINMKQNFGIYSLPTYVILDKDSKLLGHYSGAKTLTEIQNILSY